MAKVFKPLQFTERLPEKACSIYASAEGDANIFGRAVPAQLVKLSPKMKNNHRTSHNALLEMAHIVSGTSRAFLYGSGGESVGNLPADAGQMFITCPGNAGIWTSRSE